LERKRILAAWAEPGPCQGSRHCLDRAGTSRAKRVGRTDPFMLRSPAGVGEWLWWMNPIW